MLLEAARRIRNPDVQRRVFVAIMLLSGGAPFAACGKQFLGPEFSCIYAGHSNDCTDPSPSLHDAYFHAGATVSARTPAAGDNGVTLFARTGVLAPIDSSSSAPLPSNLNGPTTVNGTANLHDNITVPVYGGVTIPAKNVGIPVPNLAFEAFGGVDIKNQKFGFSLNEVGLPGGTSASQTFWTANPAAGAGIQYYLGTFGGFPTTLGAAYIVDLQLSDHNTTAASPNVPGLTYTLTDPKHVSQTAAVTLNFDLPSR